MVRIFTLLILISGLSALSVIAKGQANPSIAILPVNTGGVVNLGAVMDIKISITNTLTGTIPASKLRPVITIPAIATILPTAQQTGLPAGWSVVTNTGNGQIRICNGSAPVAGNQQVDIFIKVQGTTIGGPAQCEAQLNFGGASCSVTGPQPNGNNPIDDFATSSVTVAPGCNLAVTAAAGTILCNGDVTSISAAASAATGPVEYSITGGAPFQTSGIFSNVLAGTYTVTAREVNNPLTCVTSTTLIIAEPPAIPAPVVNIVQPGCSVANGIVTITSPTTGLTFSMDGASYAAYPPGGFVLPPGAHTIIAKNSNDCNSAITGFTVNPQPATPAAPSVHTVTQPDCTVSTGSVVLNNLPAGDWIIQPGNITGNTAVATLSNLAAGAYSFTVTNAAGCTSLPAATVNIIGVAGAPDAPAITTSQPTCTEANGSIIISSPVAGLTFSLDGAAFTTYPTGGFTGILPGTHSLIAQNSSGCLSPFTNFTINAQPASPTAPVVSLQQPGCTVATGIIMVTSATAGFTFSLDGGPFEPYPAGGYVVAAGTHFIAVQNSSGCAPNVTSNIVINAQPATPVVSATFTPITCFGSNSVITATPSGGVLPYEYSLNGSSFQSSNTFSVGAGSYTIAVRDVNGCTGISNSISITQPNALTATASAPPVSCNGGTTTLTVLATGGTGTYEYSLNNGAYQQANSFTVAAGTYTIDIRLANNPACTAVVSTGITVTQPGILKASVKANAIPVCGGTTTAVVTATGGTAPYTGTGNFVKDAGTWNFTVTDSRGCSSSAELTILPPGCLELRVFPNPSRDNITINHSAAVGTSSYLQIFSENGARIMTHQVPKDHFLTRLDITRLSAGNYIVVYINGDEKRETKFIKTNK